MPESAHGGGPNATGVISEEPCSAVAVVRDAPVRPFDEGPDGRKVGGDGEGAQQANLPGDPDARRPARLQRPSASRTCMA